MDPYQARDEWPTVASGRVADDDDDIGQQSDRSFNIDRFDEPAVAVAVETDEEDVRTVFTA